MFGLCRGWALPIWRCDVDFRLLSHIQLLRPTWRVKRALLHRSTPHLGAQCHLLADAVEKGKKSIDRNFCPRTC